MLQPPDPLTRRQWLRLSSGALLAAGLWPGALSVDAAPRSGSFDFLIINDTHHVSPECSVWLQRVVKQMRQHTTAKFCMLLGDVSDKAELTSMEAVRRILRSLSLPLYVQIGNHDYATATDRSAYEKAFPNQLNYVFRYHGWQFVSVDSTEGQKYQNSLIQVDTFSWLLKTLPKLRAERPTVLVTHFPLAEGVNYRPLNADALLDQFRKFNLRAVFGGHYHALTEKQDSRGVPFTTNRCCSLVRANHDGSKEKGYFLCRAREGSITHEFIEVKPA